MANLPHEPWRDLEHNAHMCLIAGAESNRMRRTLTRCMRAHRLYGSFSDANTIRAGPHAWRVHHCVDAADKWPPQGQFRCRQ